MNTVPETKGLTWFHQVTLFLTAVGRGLTCAYWCSVFIVCVCWQAVAMCADRICRPRPITSSGHFGMENLEDWRLTHRSWHKLLHNCILPIDSYCTEYPSYSKLQWNKGVSLCHMTLCRNLFNPDITASNSCCLPILCIPSRVSAFWGNLCIKLICSG